MQLSQLDNRNQKVGTLINPARVLDRILRFWYVLVLTLILGIACAWALNRYTTKIYPVTASMIIKESEDAATIRSLYGTTLLNPIRNYSDEFYIMRSYQLMQRVVEDLGFQISFYRKGEIKTVETYMPDFPVRFEAVNNTSLPFGKEFNFKILSNNTFRLEPTDNSSLPSLEKVLYFNSDTLDISQSRMVLQVQQPLGSLVGREYLIRFNDPYQLAVQYSKSIGLNWSQRGSGAIDLYLSSPSPEKDRDFLLHFMEVYQLFDIEKKSSTATKSMQFLDRQVDMIGDSLRFYEAQLARYAGNEIPGKGAEKISGLSEMLDEKEIQLQLQDRYYAYLEKYMTENSDLSQVLLPSALGVSDPVLSDLVGRLSDLQFKLRTLQDQTKDSQNPLIAESHQKIILYKKDIAEGIRSAKEIMRINRNMLNERLRNLQASVVTKATNNDKLVQLQRNYKFNENLYGFLVQKRSEAALSRAATVSDISILNLPSIGSPITPIPSQNYLFAILIALLLPVLVFTIQEYLNDRIQSKEDIEAITPVPVIATIGRNSHNSPLVVLEKPRSFLAESYRSLRSNLNYFVGGKDKKIILVTSSISGEGKSFTSINLASVMALAGKKTVLIAGDMRKSSIVTEFKLSNKNGLSQILSGQTSIPAAIQKTSCTDLDVIPPGPPPPNPGELFLNERLGELFAFLHTIYDNIIVDSPPIGLVSDALPLLSKVDHVVFVVRQDYTPGSAVAQLQNMVDQGQLQHVSILLNHIVKVGMGYGFRYGYAYDYGYGYRYGQNRFQKGAPKEYGYGDDAYS